MHFCIGATAILQTGNAVVALFSYLGTPSRFSDCAMLTHVAN